MAMATNPLAWMADKVGEAVGAFQAAVKAARRPDIPFLGAWAQSKRWQGGDYLRDRAHKRALQNSWVYTAISLIAFEVAVARFQVMQQTNVDDEPQGVPNHALEQILRRPNPWMGQAFLWQYTTYWLELDGNAYWYIALDRRGRPVELWPLPANEMEPMPGNEKRFVDYYEYTANGTIYQIPAEQVVHFKLPNPFDVFRGLSPLVAAMLPVDADLSMAHWNGAFFGKDNTMPSVIINLSPGDRGEVPSADVQALKDDLRENYAAHKRKTAITSAYKIEAVKLGWNQRDMDFLAGRQFTKEEIFSVYHIPGGLLDKNATYANSHEARNVIRENAVWPLLVLMDEQITTELLHPYYGSDLVASHEDVRPEDREGKLREVQAARPYMSINEVRQRYWHLPPVPWGETPAAGFGLMPGGALPSPAMPTGRDDTATQEAGREEPQQAEPEQAAREVAETKALALRMAAGNDLRRWQSKARKALHQEQSPDVAFTSRFVPRPLQRGLHQALAALSKPTDAQVKAVFIAAQTAHERTDYGEGSVPAFFRGAVPATTETGAQGGWAQYG